MLGVPVRRRKFIEDSGVVLPNENRLVSMHGFLHVADIRSHVEIFGVGGVLTLMTFYGMLKYKLAARRKH